MMVRKLLLTMLVVATAALAADDENSVRGELSPLEFLVGWCWSAQFPDKQRTDTHCYGTVFDGAHIRDRHVVSGGSTPYAGETIYSWDATRKSISYVYWNSLGGVSTGTASYSGERLTFPDEVYEGPDGATVTISSMWENISDKAYDAVIVETNADGKTTETRMRFERKPFVHQ